VLGDAGVLVPAGDNGALADAIIELIGDPRRIREMGAEARVRVEGRYGRAAMCRRFEAFYRDLVTSS
jgi:glycosyltransferase involved in cell wall biosynthesis